jgi:hypothetical protein
MKMTIESYSFLEQLKKCGDVVNYGITAIHASLFAL